MTGLSPRPYTKGWLPGGVLPEEARTTSSATTPYSPRSSIELFGCGLNGCLRQLFRHLVASDWLDQRSQAHRAARAQTRAYIASS